MVERTQKISMALSGPQQFQRAKLTLRLRLREEVSVFKYCIEALIHSQVPIDLPPLAVMPHIGEIEPALSLVAHPGKTSLECRRDSVRVGTSISCAEIEIALVPFRE